MLTYGHADVVTAEPHRWRPGLDPWRVTVEQDRWYGRGTADNKGQHTINLAALEQVLRARGGHLGFNLVILIETSEEIRIRRTERVLRAARDELAADLLIASDGPRVAAERPTVFLGSRGSAGFTLRVAAARPVLPLGQLGRPAPQPGHGAGQRDGLPGDGHGRILVPGLRPPPIPATCGTRCRHPGRRRPR